MAGTGFIWFWKNDQGSWTPYGDEHQDAIERSRLQGEDHVILQIGPNQTPYLLDFKDEIQENLELGHRRLISRANEFTVWYWRDDDGISWNLFDQEHADTLTRAEAEQEPEVYLVIHETLYRIDLPRRLQINFDHQGTANDTREIRQGRGISSTTTATTTTPQDNSNNNASNNNNGSGPTIIPHDDDDPSQTDYYDQTFNESFHTVDPDMERAAPQPFLCPISFHVMKDPVTTSAGSTYDRKNIQWWLKDHDTDPLTKRPIGDKLLVPNNAMKYNIEEWKREYYDNLIQPAIIEEELQQQQSSSPSQQQQQQQQQQQTKTSGSSSDDFCNDTLKVVFVGQNKIGITSIIQGLVQQQKKDCSNTSTDNGGGCDPSPGVQIYDWRPNNNNHNNNQQQIQFCIWDFEGQDSLHSYRSICFSPQTLYVVVWDMMMGISTSGDGGGAAHAARELQLERDIQEKVQFWIDRIQERVPNNAIILPLASFSDATTSTFPPPHHHQHQQPQQQQQQQQQRGNHMIRQAEAVAKEAKRRCRVLKERLLKATARSTTTTATILFGPDDDDPVLRVSCSGTSTSIGLDKLQKTLLDLVRSDNQLFDHVGGGRSHLPPLPHVQEFQNTIRRTIHSFRDQGYKLVDRDRLVAAIAAAAAGGQSGISTEDMRFALQWLFNIGEILYFPTLPAPFETMIVLDIVWFYRLSGCILRHDWKVLVSDGRRRKGRDPPPSFGGAVNENCPVISKEDASMLWLNHLATTDYGSSPSAEIFTLMNLLDFIETVMIHYGVLVPVDQDVGPLSNRNLYPPNYYHDDNNNRYIPVKAPQTMSPPTCCYLDADLHCIPNLLRKGDHGRGLSDISFAAAGSSTTTSTRLARKVQFLQQQEGQRGVPDCLMEKIIVSLLRNITTALKENDDNDDDSNCSIAVERVHCWRSLFRVRFGWKKSSNMDGNSNNNSNNNHQETTVEICSQLVDSPANANGGIGVGSNDDHHANQPCLFTSANVIKGDGGGGSRIWEAGYGIVLETIQAVLEGHQGLKFVTSVFCHECLASRGIHGSHSWTTEEIDAALKDGDRALKCRRGHSASLHLLTGTGTDVDTKEIGDLDPTLKKAIVLVGLYDARKRTNKVRRFGSGVVVDAARGLIVTAARNVMKIEGEEQFGQNYDGILGGKVVIGVIPSSAEKGSEEEAVFRYYAKIVSKDPALTDPSSSYKVCHVDACVLKITSRFECDVEGNGDGCCDEIELLLRDNARKIAAQCLVELPIQIKSNLEERVRIFGFQQSSNDNNNNSSSSTEANRRLSHVEGYICQKKKTNGNTPGDPFTYQPSKTTVVMANARQGHIGGPCLNQEGEIIGILACGDPDEDSRSFVVPVSEWEALLQVVGSGQP